MRVPLVGDGTMEASQIATASLTISTKVRLEKKGRPTASEHPNFRREVVKDFLRRDDTEFLSAISSGY